MTVQHSLVPTGTGNVECTTCDQGFEEAATAALIPCRAPQGEQTHFWMVRPLGIECASCDVWVTSDTDPATIPVECLPAHQNGA